VQRNFATGFEDSYRRYLVPEQRKAVLETIARELSPTTTLGDIVDAAQELGWGDAIGEMNLGELAQALLGERVTAAAAPAPAPEPERPAAAEPEEDEEEEELAEEDEDEGEEEEDELEDEEEEEEEEEPAKPARKASPARGKKTAAKKAAKAGKKAAKAAAQTSLPLGGAHKGDKKAAKKAGKKAPPPEPDFDDSTAMNLEQASKLLVPLVRKLKEATMQDLERETGMGRRKLRFHIGQLVKHGRLKRHGMGRGTCYTVK
jgi:hypothetical protein